MNTTLAPTAPKRIDRFMYRWRFLSNFYPCQIEYDHVNYPSLEHAFQAAKCENSIERVSILRATSPGAAKRMGQRVLLRKHWDVLKLDIMRELVRQKFNRHADLGLQLLATGEALLIEGNDWGDQFWGWDNTARRGQNWLGRILMEVREQLRESKNL